MKNRNLAVSKALQTPIYPREDLPLSSSSTLFTLLRGRTFWAVFVLPSADFQWRSRKQYLSAGDVSDVLSLRTLSSLYYV
jgi:hypothetical protein